MKAPFQKLSSVQIWASIWPRTVLYGLTSLLAPRVAALAGLCGKQVNENMIALTGIERVKVQPGSAQLVLSRTK
jgi:hypothetical protein